MKAKVIVPIIIGVAIVGGLLAFLVRQQTDPYGNLPEMDFREYLQTPGALYGNRYLLVCEVDKTISYEEGLGRLLAVRDFENGPRVPVFISENLDGNVHVGQRYRMKVFIRDQGLIYVEAMQKY